MRHGRPSAPPPRRPVGAVAGLRDLLDAYVDTSLAFRLFLAHRWWHAHLSDLERCVRPAGAVLDLGCGHGIFANLMGLRGPGRRIIALERDPTKAALARGRVANVTVEEADVMRTALPRVDAVTITDVLHHLGSWSEQETLIDAAGSALPHGGQLVVKEITRSRPIRYRLTWVLDRIAFPHDTFYFRRHEELAALLERKGFTVEFRPLWAGTPYGSYVHLCTKR